MQGRGLTLLSALLLCAPAARALDVERLEAPVFGPNGQGLGRGSVGVVSRQALVRFDPSRTPAARAAAMASVGGQVLGEMPAVGWTKVQLPAGMPVSAGLTLLRGLAGALEVAPNYALRTVKVPNDPSVPAQYHLSKVNAFAAWEYETGLSSQVTVAVVDSGIQGTGNSEVSSKLVGTSKFFDPNTGSAQSDDQPPTPACNHGTQVAGVAAAVTNNGVGVAGISWDAKLISLKVFSNGDCNPGGACPFGCTTDSVSISSAILHAITLQNTPTHGRIVVNISLGPDGTPPFPACPGVLQNTINSAIAAGLVIVASAGNNGPSDNSIGFPANCTGVIPVGATDSNDSIASFSSRGSELAANGVVAPGKGVVTATLGGGTAGVDGTSFSSPLVAGIAALILSAKAADPAYAAPNTASKIQTILRSSVDNIGVSVAGITPLGNSSGAGRVNAYNALRLAVNGTLSDFQGKQKAIAFPNPFRPSEHGTVTITIPDSIQGKNPKISIYTMDGLFVREIPGQTWDGKNTAGRPVASGVYIFVVKTDSGMQRGRVAVLR